MANGERLNEAGFSGGSQSGYMFGSGKKSYRKYLGLDPAVTGVGDSGRFIVATPPRSGLRLREQEPGTPCRFTVTPSPATPRPALLPTSLDATSSELQSRLMR